MTQHINLSLTNRIDDIHDIMFDSLGLFYIKDLKGNYLYLNQNVASTAGSNHTSELLGKNDYKHEFPWQEYGRLYQRNDESINPHKQPIKVMELIKSHKGKTSLILSHKKPFYHQGKLEGIFGLSLTAPSSSPSTPPPLLTKESVFFDIKQSTVIHLSKKQKKVAYLVLQGLASKHIAEKIFLSKRTIEHHIESIKENCKYTSTKELLLYLRML